MVRLVYDYYEGRNLCGFWLWIHFFSGAVLAKVSWLFTTNTHFFSDAYVV
jgi:hypothetical protein